MWMKQMLQAIITLLASNTFTTVGVVAIVTYLVIMYKSISFMLRERNWYTIVYIIMYTIIVVCVLVSAPAITDFCNIVINKVNEFL